MAAVVVPLVLLPLIVGFSISWAVRTRLPLQWSLAALTFGLGGLALVLFAAMALGAWPTYAAFLLAGGAVVLATIQAFHYLAHRER